MKKKTFIIKHMVCQRCIEAVEEIFEASNAELKAIDLGEVTALVAMDFDDEALAQNLEKRGFELVEDKEEVLVEKTKAAIVKLVHYLESKPNLTNSVWLEEELSESYQKISRTFSKITDTTVEKYLILQKIERAKELISYHELSFDEISFKLGYKSLSHLSNQFKEITGFSLTQYKNDQNQSRTKIDEI